MSRLIGRLTVGPRAHDAMTIHVRREGSELRVSVAGAGGISLSSSYVNFQAKPPVFAAGSDEEALQAVARWSEAGGNPVREMLAAPPPPDTDEYRRGLRAALALCNNRPTAHAFSVAAEIRALLGEPAVPAAPPRRRRRPAVVVGG